MLSRHPCIIEVSVSHLSPPSPFHSPSLPGANAALLLYDITNSSTFEDVRGWLQGVFTTPFHLSNAHSPCRTKEELLSRAHYLHRWCQSRPPPSPPGHLRPRSFVPPQLVSSTQTTTSRPSASSSIYALLHPSPLHILPRPSIPLCPIMFPCIP